MRGSCLLRCGSSLVRAGLGLGLLSVTGCVAAAAGAGTTVAFGSAAALTASCYDRVSLSLTDAVSGQRSCVAKVSAVDADGSEVDFNSCYHAAVPPGAWTVRAEQPGYAAATTRLIVPEESSCNPAVQSIELTIAPAGFVRPVAAPAPAERTTSAPPASAPTAPATSAPAAPPASAPTGQPAPAPATTPSPSPTPTTGPVPAPHNTPPAPTPAPVSTPTAAPSAPAPTTPAPAPPAP